MPMVEERNSLYVGMNTLGLQQTLSQTCGKKLSAEREESKTSRDNRNGWIQGVDGWRKWIDGGMNGKMVRWMTGWMSSSFSSFKGTEVPKTVSQSMRLYLSNLILHS